MAASPPIFFAHFPKILIRKYLLSPYTFQIAAKY